MDKQLLQHPASCSWSLKRGAKARTPAEKACTSQSFPFSVDTYRSRFGLISKPVSSSTSRTAAFRGFSPCSPYPPGSPQCSGYFGQDILLRTKSIRSSGSCRTTTAAKASCDGIKNPLERHYCVGMHSASSNCPHTRNSRWVLVLRVPLCKTAGGREAWLCTPQKGDLSSTREERKYSLRPLWQRSVPKAISHQEVQDGVVLLRKNMPGGVFHLSARSESAESQGGLIRSCGPL